MPIDFPSAPLVNDIYTSAGFSWICASVNPNVWRRVGSNTLPGQTLKGNANTAAANWQDLSRKQVLAMLRPGDIHLHLQVGAAADGKFCSVATANGFPTIERVSGAGTFTAADVGKKIQIDGAGPGGGLLTATIISVEGPDDATLGTNAGATVVANGAQWGTDNTDAFNEAISELTEGGRVLLGPGYTFVGSANLTHKVSVAVEGLVAGYNNFTLPQVGCVLIPTSTSDAMLDCTGSVGITLRRMQLGVTGLGSVKGACAVLLANSASKSGATFLLEDVTSAGRWAKGGLYCYGTGDASIFRGGFSNRAGDNFAGVFTRDNVYAMESLYQTIATGEQGMGNWDVWGAQWFDADINNLDATTGGGLLLRGAASMRFWGNLMASAAGALGNIAAYKVGSTNPSVLMVGNTLYSETPGHAAKYSYFCESPGSLQISGFGNSYTFGTAKTGGGGAFTYTAVEA